MLKEDPPAVYIRKPSFHEADFGKPVNSQSNTGRNTNQGSKSRKLIEEDDLAKGDAHWCDPSAILDQTWCDTSGLLDHVLALGTKSVVGSEGVVQDLHLSSPSSHDFSEFSTDDSSANQYSTWPQSFDHDDAGSNRQSKERRGRFLVWPAKH